MQSPCEVAPEKLKDIQVWGTMPEGRVQPVGGKIPKAPAKPAAVRSSSAPAKLASPEEAELARATTASLARLLAPRHDH
jgi:hypothetical protein